MSQDDTGASGPGDSDQGDPNRGGSNTDEGQAGRQIDPRPLDDVTTTTQESASGFDVAIVQSPRIHRLYAYWRDKAGAGMPARSGFDPVDVRELLPNLMMVDVLGTPPRFRYRLVGTRVVQYTGFDFTGRYLDEMVFQGRDFIEDCYLRVLNERRPIFGHYAWLVRSRHFGRCEFGLFPLSDDGKRVDRCVSIEDYERMERDILAFGHQKATLQAGRKS
jgi:hypothetical protein